MEPMLALYCLERPYKSLRYACVATFGSVLGGITSYFLGYGIWHYAGEQILHNKIVNYILTPHVFNHICSLYQHYSYWALLAAGFMPIPFKAATLTAGICELPILPVIICTIIARGFRLFVLAITIKIWGVKMKQLIDRYFNILALLALILIGCIIYFTR
jgi:membrane protein YqaA with SNARE-associated domain